MLLGIIKTLVAIMGCFFVAHAMDVVEHEAVIGAPALHTIGNASQGSVADVEAPTGGIFCGGDVTKIGLVKNKKASEERMQSIRSRLEKSFVTSVPGVVDRQFVINEVIVLARYCFEREYRIPRNLKKKFKHYGFIDLQGNLYPETPWEVARLLERYDHRYVDQIPALYRSVI
jgi:hypothetical protein